MRYFNFIALRLNLIPFTVAVAIISASCSPKKQVTVSRRAPINSTTFQTTKPLDDEAAEMCLLLDFHESYLLTEGPQHRGVAFQVLARHLEAQKELISPLELLLCLGLPDYIDPGDKHDFVLTYFCKIAQGRNCAVMVIVEHDKIKLIGFNDASGVDITQSVPVHSFEDLPFTFHESQ